jgi:hypothetical protein
MRAGLTKLILGKALKRKTGSVPEADKIPLQKAK